MNPTNKKLGPARDELLEISQHYLQPNVSQESLGQCRQQTNEVDQLWCIHIRSQHQRDVWVNMPLFVSLVVFELRRPISDLIAAVQVDNVPAACVNLATVFFDILNLAALIMYPVCCF